MHTQLSYKSWWKLAFFVRVEKFSTCTVVVLHTCLVDKLIIIYYIYLSLTFSMTFVSRCFVLYPLHLLSSSVEPPICLRVITIVCPLYVHRMSTVSVDIRWRCGGDSVDILCSHIEGTEESEWTYLGGLSDSKWRSGVESTHHHRMFFCTVMPSFSIVRILTRWIKMLNL